LNEMTVCWFQNPDSGQAGMTSATLVTLSGSKESLCCAMHYDTGWGIRRLVGCVVWPLAGFVVVVLVAFWLVLHFVSSVLGAFRLVEGMFALVGVFGARVYRAVWLVEGVPRLVYTVFLLVAGILLLVVPFRPSVAGILP
jgi:hypothetical protein